jgi:hypothetical protein
VLTAKRHCPAGVAEPTYAPSAALAITPAASGSITSAPTASASASHDHDDDDDDHSHAVTASTCEPHGDHWHCPSGVAVPTTAPAQTLSTSAGGAAVSGTSGSTSSAPAEATGAASAVSAGQQGIVAIVLGAVSAFFL